MRRFLTLAVFTMVICHQAVGKIVVVKERQEENGFNWQLVRDTKNKDTLNNFGVKVGKQLIVPCEYSHISIDMSGYFLHANNPQKRKYIYDELDAKLKAFFIVSKSLNRQDHITSYAIFDHMGGVIMTDNELIREPQCISYYKSNDNDAYIFQYKDTIGRCGVMDDRGNILVQPMKDVNSIKYIVSDSSYDFGKWTYDRWFSFKQWMPEHRKFGCGIVKDGGIITMSPDPNIDSVAYSHCKYDNYRKYNFIRYYDKNKNVGIMDSYGRVKTPAQEGVKDLWWRDEENLYYYYDKDGNCGLMAQDGTIIFYAFGKWICRHRHERDDFDYYAYSKEDFTLVNDRKGLIKTDGTIIIPYKEDVIASVFGYSDGIIHCHLYNYRRHKDYYVDVVVDDCRGTVVYTDINSKECGLRDKFGNDLVEARVNQTFTYYEVLDFDYYIVTCNGNNGIISTAGKWVIPYKEGQKIEKRENDFLIMDNGNVGLMNKSFAWIIPISDGYKRIEDKGTFYEVSKEKSGGSIGLVSKTGKDIVSTYQGYKQIAIVTCEGRNYYRVSKSSYSGPYGLLDIKGNEVLPVEYESLDYIGNNYLKFRINGYYGLMTLDGDVIIPTSRGYTSIGNYVKSQKIFPYTMDGYKGECDNLGKEISRIKVSAPQRDLTTTSSNSSSSTASNSSRSSSSNKEKLPEGLLYKGLYTQSMQGRAQSTGGYTGIAGPDLELEVEIYEDKMVVNGMEYKYTGTKNGRRMYRGGFNNENIYYVSSNYNMYMESEFSGMFGVEWFTYEVTKGRSLMPKYTPEFSGSGSSGSYSGRSSSSSSGSRSSSSNGTRSTSRKACQACQYRNGKCGVCNGTGKKRTTYAGRTTVVDCNNCHRTGRCPVCWGDGWID